MDHDGCHSQGCHSQGCYRQGRSEATDPVAGGERVTTGTVEGGATVEGGRTALTPRDRMVRSAAQLIRRQGVSGTGMREIVIEAGAPRGSLQHYFPEGKEELVGEALLWMGAVATRRLGRHLERLDPATPGALLAAMAGDWRSDLTTEGYAGGCPLLAAAADTATTSDRLRGVLRQAFDSWEQQLAAALVQLGVPAGRAPGWPPWSSAPWKAPSSWPASAATWRRWTLWSPSWPRYWMTPPPRPGAAATDPSEPGWVAAASRWYRSQ